MIWEQKFCELCNKKGYIICGYENGWIFIKDNSDNIFPIRETKAMEWINNIL